MIRTFRVWVAAFLLLAVVLGQITWAGESDGVTGYSMRLKNKDFTTGDDGGTGPGSSAVVSLQKGDQELQPKSLTTTNTNRLWFVSIPFRFAMFTIWVR